MRKIYLYSLNNLDKIDRDKTYTFFDKCSESLLDNGALEHPAYQKSPMLWNFNNPTRYMFLPCDCCVSDDMYIVCDIEKGNDLIEKLQNKIITIINAL